MPELLWWHLQHLHPSDAETWLAFQTQVLLLHCYGVTGVSAVLSFSNQGRTGLSRCTVHSLPLLVAKSSQGENTVRAQPRLKRPNPTSGLLDFTLVILVLLCFRKHSEDGKDSQASGQDLQIHQNI